MRPEQEQGIEILTDVKRKTRMSAQMIRSEEAALFHEDPYVVHVPKTQYNAL